MDGDEWTLSPAFDITFSSGVNGQHNMTVAGSGLPGNKELLALAKGAGLGDSRARAILEEISSAILRWPAFATKAGVSSASRDLVASKLKTQSAGR